MDVSLDEQGRIMGFGGTSRDVPAPPAVARAAERLAGLTGKWDDAVHRGLFGNDAKGLAERKAFFEKVRARHGACAPKGYTRTDHSQEIRLACQHGGDLALTLVLDPKDEGRIQRFTLVPTGGGVCPLR
jgi:hypothetical protein